MNSASLGGRLQADLQLEEEILFGLRPRRAKAQPATAHAEQARREAAVGLAGVREQARREPGRRFDALLHHVDVELLQFSYHQLRKEGVRGGGGRTWTDYGVDLRTNAVQLYTRLQRGRHRTLPSWRCVMAMAQGQRQSLKRAALKDRIVQRAVAEVLLAVYQPDFMPFAACVEPLRLKDDALDRLAGELTQASPRWVVEARIAGLCASLGCKALLRSLQPRIGDARLLALIGSWVKAGVMEEAGIPASTAGPPAGAITGLLANIYCHHAFDLWAARWRQRHARSPVVLVRDAGRLVAAFEHKPGARRFMTDLRARLQQCAPGLPARNLRLSSAGCYTRERLKPDGQDGT